MNMESHNFWEENRHEVNYNLSDSSGREQSNITVASDDGLEYPPGSFLIKRKVSRQQNPVPHRIIEKRRQDHLNNCLADLSRLIPPDYLKKNRGRVEKTMIIEMAIRHLKCIQERANGLHDAYRRYDYDEPQQDNTRTQGSSSETSSSSSSTDGYAVNGVIVQAPLAAPAYPECERKDQVFPMECDRGSSSETTSSSSSSDGYAVNGVIVQAPPLAPPAYPECERKDQVLPMECDRVSVTQLPSSAESEVCPEEPLPLDGRRKSELPTLRADRKPDHNEDYLCSYKFKNSIERQFSRSQENKTGDMVARSAHAHNKMYTHKRHRAAKPDASTSASDSTSALDSIYASDSTSAPGFTSASDSTDARDRDTSHQDTSSGSPHHHHYEKPAPPTQYVTVFALNALGNYYVPLSVDYAYLSRQLCPYDVSDAHSVHLTAPLHPVTIQVNFQPCLNYHVKREPDERKWGA